MLVFSSPSCLMPLLIPLHLLSPSLATVILRIMFVKLVSARPRARNSVNGVSLSDRYTDDVSLIAEPVLDRRSLKTYRPEQRDSNTDYSVVVVRICSLSDPGCRHGSPWFYRSWPRMLTLWLRCVRHIMSNMSDYANVCSFFVRASICYRPADWTAR